LWFHDRAAGNSRQRYRIYWKAISTCDLFDVEKVDNPYTPLTHSEDDSPLWMIRKRDLRQQSGRKSVGLWTVS
jgi:hypothetical protein